MSRLGRRRSILLIGALLLIAIVASSVVPSREDRAVFVVSRVGSAVRLLPRHLAFSSLLIDRRVVVPRHGDEALLQIPLLLTYDASSTVPATLRVGVQGSGAVPVDAAQIRAVGWEKAWQNWAEARLRLSPEEQRKAIEASRRWRAIFTADASSDPDLMSRLQGTLAPLRVVRADLDLSGADAAVRAAAVAQVTMLSQPRGRLVVVGLDALDWGLVDELTRRGVMPNVRDLVGRSVQAELDVPKPLISPVVWTTIATGVRPEEHGVLDFLEHDPNGGARPVSAASRNAPALWEMAAAAGRSTAVVGWWATFPANAPPRGRIYSDRLTEQLLGLEANVPHQADPSSADAIARRLVVRADQIAPASFAPFLQVSDRELDDVRRGGGWDTPIGGLAKLVAATLTVEALTDHELRAGTDVVLTYLEGTDTVGHLFARYRPPALPGVDAADAARFGGIVDRYYAHVDSWIGRIRSQLGPNDTLAIVSDHGFTWGNDRPRVASGVHSATAVWWHKPVGVFLASGPGIRPSSRRERMGVLDVAPLLLRLAGLPQAVEMPGRVPPWLSSVRSVPEPSVRYDALLAPQRAPAMELPKSAQDEEMAKLTALGYLAGASAKPSAPAAGTPAPPQPDRAEARRLTNLGTSRAEAGDDPGAEEAFRQAVEADPGYAAASYNLSLTLRKEARLDEADAYFWRSVGAGIADRELAVVRLALDYRQRGDFERASAVLATGRARFPSSAAIWLNSGVFLGERGNLAEARVCLERAVQLAPNNAEAHRNLGVALLASGEKSGAIRELSTALRLDPNLEAVRSQLNALGVR